jgi:hypothetical protein
MTNCRALAPDFPFKNRLFSWKKSIVSSPGIHESCRRGREVACTGYKHLRIEPEFFSPVVCRRRNDIEAGFPLCSQKEMTSGSIAPPCLDERQFPDMLICSTVVICP